MPELLGFEEKNGEIVAVIHYPNARRFVLTPKEAAPISASEKNNNGGKDGR